MALLTTFNNANKADKVADASAGDIATLDATGNLSDSGKKPSDFVPLDQYNTLLANFNSLLQNFNTLQSQHNRLIEKVNDFGWITGGERL